MKREMIFNDPPKSAEDEFVQVSIPKSTWHLFNAVAEQPVTEASPRYLNQIETSMAFAGDLYPIPDEFTEKGAPGGRLTMGELSDSVFYPGTHRKYWLYEPAYGGEGPLPLIVMLDANFFMLDEETGMPKSDPELARMFDNLIAEKKIPPSVVLFAGYGEPGPGQPVNGFSEGEVNRSFEYDMTSDWHARFLEEELLPTVLKGRRISADPADHVLCGFSSSGIAAFCAAWFRPEFFGKLFLGSPSFVNIRSGIVWPSAIRINEKKDIKVFQTAGQHDLDNIFGSWLVGNYDVASALHYAGYDHLFYLTEAGHSLAVYYYTLPQGLAWLFGGPEPVFSHMEKRLFDEVID